jgi:flagellar basal-body rod protein FlgF
VVDTDKESLVNGLYLAASGAASQLSALDAATINLANGAVPGSQRFVQVMRAVHGGGTPYLFAETAPVRIRPAQGDIYSTGNPLDIAMTEPGLFVAVQTPNGTAYTRNGQLQRAADGGLLAAGNPILKADGEPISLPAGTVTIGNDGSISLDGLPAARMQLGDATGITMVPAGPSLYKAANGEPLPPPPAAANSMRQGYLESSGGSTIRGMVGLTGIIRNYESAMRAVQAIDDDQNRAIQAFTLSA